MFCLDYALACAVHFQLSRAVSDAAPWLDQRTGAAAVFLGATSGLTSAVALYPFDFVRQATTSGSRFALSSIPFSACFFGVYFSQCRPEDSPSRQAGWALAAASAATVAEYPFGA